MQPSFAPTHWRISPSRPSRAFRGMFGSAMSARVMPTTSIDPSARIWSACTGSTMRVAWKMGTSGTACLIAAASGTYTALGYDMFGTAPAWRANVWAAPPMIERKSTRPEAARRWAISPMSSAVRPPSVNSSPEIRAPTT